MKNMLIPDYSIEENYTEKGLVLGLDEVGRGCWAGPLTVAAFWINPSFLRDIPNNVNDSKLLSKKIRKKIELKIKNKIYNNQWKVKHINSKIIDKLGIQKATYIAFNSVVLSLSEILSRRFKSKISMVLIDGNYNFNFSFPSKNIIKGDQKSLSISSASIIAKQERDKLMTRLSINYPQYNWDKNVGYGTLGHKEAIEKFGISKYHRKSYKPILKIHDQLNN